MKSMCISILLLLISVFVYGVEVKTVDAKTHTMDSLSITDGRLQAGELNLPLEEIISCRWSNTSNTHSGLPRILLHDGDLLIAEIKGGDEDNIEIVSPAVGRITLPITRIRSIQFADKPLELEPGAEDILVFANGDRVSGTLVKFQKGGLVFESVIGVSHYGFESIAHLGISGLGASEIETPNPDHFRLLTTGGDRITCTRIQVMPEQAAVHTRSLGRLNLPSLSLVGIEIMYGRLVNLSSLEPDAVSEKSYWDGGYIWHFRKNKSIDGNPLTLNGTVYSHGLGVHSACTLTYNINGGFTRFISDVGIDDEVNAYGSVDIAVRGDGKILFEHKDVTFGQKAISIDIALENVQVLELVVDFGKQFDIGDHVDWAGASLIRKPRR